MKLRGRHMVLLLGLWMMSVVVRGQEEICTLEDGKLVFHLNKSWSDEKRLEISEQFGLDTMMLDLVLAGPSGGTFEFEGAQWVVEQKGNGMVRLSKNMEELTGSMNLKKDMLLTPNDLDSGIMGGPGYVDEERVVYGVNRLKENVIVQYPNGKTKIELPGYLEARDVIISGSFNGWSTSGYPMEKTDEGWEIELQLSPGKYLYKFIVDGQWIRDRQNALYESDGWGGKNSALYRYNYKFELDGYTDAKKVYVAGSFNNWNERQLKMTRTANGWVMPIYLKEGTHSYKFVVDGEWLTDPDNPVVRPDGGGNFNSVLALGDTTMFRLNGYSDANEVRLAGSFNGWNPAELVMTKTSGGWELPYVLSKGNYEYKFIVDGEWMTDPNNPYFIIHGDYRNSFMAIEPNYDFALAGFPAAEKVMVTGTFTGWSYDNNQMVQKDGRWIFPIHLKPGKYTYKYVIDGEWITDPDNPAYEENEFGTDNSVLWIEPEGLAN